MFFQELTELGRAVGILSLFAIALGQRVAVVDHPFGVRRLEHTNVGETNPGMVHRQLCKSLPYRRCLYPPSRRDVASAEQVLGPDLLNVLELRAPCEKQTESGNIISFNAADSKRI